MLHKAPAILAATSGVFVIGVLIYAAGGRLPSLTGELMGGMMPGMTSSAPAPAGSMPGVPVLGMDPSMMPVEDGPWIDPDGNPVDVSVVVEESGEGSGESTGGDTGGVTGSTGGSGGAEAPTCPYLFREFKTSNREVCRCGSSADDLQKKFTEGQQKLTMGNPNMAPACPSPRCVDSVTTPYHQNPSLFTHTAFKVKRTIVAGRGDASRAWEKAQCKSGQLVACFKAEGHYSAMRICVTPTSAAETRANLGIPLPTPGTVTPPVLYKCCSGGTDRYCERANKECFGLSPMTSGSKTYNTENCNLECEPIVAPVNPMKAQ